VAVVKVVRKRGATFTIEAYPEVLLLPSGPIGRLNNSLSQRIRRAVAAEAPSNKRPRWAHYGKPLKQTMRASTRVDVRRMMAHSAVGSTANYSLFVDQGTKSFMAKILPPWTRNSPSLYEHTWKVPDEGGGQYREIGRIRVSGQKAQMYMSRGLQAGLASMRLATRKDYGSPAVAYADQVFPDSIANFIGATPADAAFMASLTQWRAWRDEAWKSGRVLGLGYNRERQRREYRRTINEARSLRRYQDRREADRVRSRARSKAYRERQRQINPPKSRQTAAQRAERYKADAMRAAASERASWLAKHPGYRAAGSNPAGFYVIDARGNRYFHYWSVRVADLFAESGVKFQPLPPGTKTI
jgi:hypothetical protein